MSFSVAVFSRLSRKKGALSRQCLGAPARSKSSSTVVVFPSDAHFHHEHFQLFENVISVDDESSLIAYIDTLVQRKRYNKSHFDDVIQNYRETELYTEKLSKFPQTAACLERLKAFVGQKAKIDHIKMLPPHVIDLHASGNIGAHIDSVKFSGSMIAGLSLKSTRIMRLKLSPDHEEVCRQNAPKGTNTAETIEFIVKPRSLYLLSGPIRYCYTHEILGSNKGELIQSHFDVERRLSIIIRNNK